MKIIKVSDEIYDFLINLSKEIKTQDSRATRSPYYFQVQEDEEICVPDGCGEEVWVMDGGVCLRTEEDIKEAVFEWYGWTIGNQKHESEYKTLLDATIEDVLRENYRKVNIDIKHKYDNCFFTLKAYEEHLSQNRHNLNNPKSFLFHAYRNSEMDMIFKFLEHLTD